MARSTYIYMVHGAGPYERPSRWPSGPLAAFTVKHELVAYLRRLRQDGEPNNPGDDLDHLTPSTVVVFRVRDACTYFANTPITGAQVLAGEPWHDGEPG